MDSPVLAESPAFQIWSAGVDAVRAENLVHSRIGISESTNELSICGKQYSLEGVERVCVVGAGKAAGYLGKALEDLLASAADRFTLFGHINVPENCIEPTQHITLHAARPAGVNEPRIEGVAGAKKIIDLVSSLHSNDLCIALITGGGSALLPLPTDGLTLEDKLRVTRIMSSRGASIQELNQVRIALSGIKGGRLAGACSASRLVTVIVSDVIGDPLGLIASGPTVVSTDTESTTAPKEILARFATESELPEQVWRCLEKRQKPTVQSPPQLDHHILANNAAAASAAADNARELGYVVEELAPESPKTSAEQVAESIISHVSRFDAKEKRCLIWGGEPIVQLAAPENRGLGGRNQQLVLKAASLWSRLPEELQSRLSILSGGTDGEDGPTDAAGACISKATVDELQARQFDVDDFLQRNDAYSVFDAVNALIKTGPTHTNVCDLRIATVN